MNVNEFLSKNIEIALTLPMWQIIALLFTIVGVWIFSILIAKQPKKVINKEKELLLEENKAVYEQRRDVDLELAESIRRLQVLQHDNKQVMNKVKPNE